MANIKKYKVGEIRGILEEIYNDPIERRTKVPIFMSDPGMGKTMIIEQFMKDKEVYRPPFVLSQRMPFELSGMALVDKDKDKMKYYDFDFLLDLKDGSILFIDEALNSIPATINAFLTFLESRVMISGKKLPDIMIIAAANHQGTPVLTPQIKRRFVYYDIEFDRKSWSEFINKKYQIRDIPIPKKILTDLHKLIEAEDFIGYNFDTPADLDKAIYSMIKGHKTPYNDSLQSILNYKIKNPLNETINFGNGKLMTKDGSISWLELKQLTNEIIKK